MYRELNLNPEQKRVGDCTVRAIAAATHQEWDAVYAALVLTGFELNDMPSANYVWGSYLRRIGWKRYTLPNSCPDCYTVAQFAKDHPDGTYILAMATHVVCVQNGDWLDTWDSGDEVPLYYWQKG
nr:MAG: Putative papain-like endopeptidase [Bacteriophage sp.]